MENITVAVADNIIDKNMLLRIVTSILNEEDYSESLKLEMIDCLSRVIPDPDGDNYISSGSDFFLNLF